MDGLNVFTADTMLLYRNEHIQWSVSCTPIDTVVEAPPDWGSYYIGFHVYSNPSSQISGFSVDDFSIEQVVSSPYLPLDSHEHFFIHPVPAKDEAFLNLLHAEPGPLTLEVRDLSGRLLLREEVALTEEGMREIRIDLSSLSPGMYYLRAFNQQWTQTLPLVKE